MKLKNKVAIVTGASRGIGAAIAKRLAAEGATVAITYVKGKEHADAVVNEIKKNGGNALSLQADSADTQAVSGAVTKIAEQFGRLDILVNNAGVAVMGKIDEERNETDFQNEFAVNVSGPVAAVHTATKYLKAGGRIISIGSCLGARSAFAGNADYSASKAAIAAYTKGWAWDLGAKGITVNAVQPGPIETDMNPATGEFADFLISRSPLGRYGQAEDIAAAVAFLASEEASYITGSTLDVDGGQNA